MTESAGTDAITYTGEPGVSILGTPCPALIYLSEHVAVGCKHQKGHDPKVQLHEVTLAWTEDVAHVARVA